MLRKGKVPPISLDYDVVEDSSTEIACFFFFAHVSRRPKRCLNFNLNTDEELTSEIFLGGEGEIGAIGRKCINKLISFRTRFNQLLTYGD